jgi:hypothetical protein
LIPFLITAAALAFGLPPFVDFIHRQGWLSALPSFLYVTTWLIALTTAILFIYLYRSEKRRFFVQFYLLSMVVKLVAYLAYNLIVILQDRSGAFANVLYFLLVYFMFTAIEIGFLYRKISPRSRP